MQVIVNREITKSKLAPRKIDLRRKKVLAFLKKRFILIP